MCGQLSDLLKVLQQSELLPGVSFSWRLSPFLTALILTQESRRVVPAQLLCLCPCLWLPHSHRVPVEFVVLRNASSEVLDRGVTEIRAETLDCIWIACECWALLPSTCCWDFPAGVELVQKERAVQVFCKEAELNHKNTSDGSSWSTWPLI